MNWEVISLDHLRDQKWRTFYSCGYILLPLQQRHSSHSNHERTCLSDTAQILSLLTLIRCSGNQQSWVNLSGPCWVSHEKETLKDNVTGCVTSSRWTGIHIVLIPHSGLNFLLTLCRHRSSCRFMLGFLHGWTRKSLKEAEKLFHFPNVVKSKWPHFSFGITLGSPEVAGKITVTIKISGF